jgi:hypothetical protein
MFILTAYQAQCEFKLLIKLNVNSMLSKYQQDSVITNTVGAEL